jgi:hypothetical protein
VSTEPYSRCCNFNASRTANHELDTELFLELPHLTRECRLRYEEHFGGARDVSLPGNFYKRSQVSEFHKPYRKSMAH